VPQARVLQPDVRSPRNVSPLRAKHARPCALRLGHRRADFSPEELKAGATVYFEQKEGRSSGPVVYRLRVLERRGPELWTFYGISSTTTEASSLASVSPPCMPAERNPPLAP
jgi:hypothetical protein